MLHWKQPTPKTWRGELKQVPGQTQPPAAEVGEGVRFRSTWDTPALLLPMVLLVRSQAAQSYSVTQDLKWTCLKVTSKLSLETFRVKVLKAPICSSVVTLKLWGVEGKKSKHKKIPIMFSAEYLSVVEEDTPLEMPDLLALCCLLLSRTAQALSGSCCFTEPLLTAKIKMQICWRQKNTVNSISCPEKGEIQILVCQTVEFTES